MDVMIPLNFSYEVSTTSLDSHDLAFCQTLTQVLNNGDFFFIKIHVLHRIIYLPRAQLQELPEHYESSYLKMFLSYEELMETNLFLENIFDTMVPRALRQSMMPEVRSYARNLREAPRSNDFNGETNGCRLFNLVLDIEINGIYNDDDEVVNMVMEESAEQIQMVPASKTAIDSLKKVNFGKNITMEECRICLEKFIEKEEVSIMPCNHIYHEECITKWLQKSGMCPLCRYSMSKNTT